MFLAYYIFLRMMLSTQAENAWLLLFLVFMLQGAVALFT
jgi:hypothetical protein